MTKPKPKPGTKPKKRGAQPANANAATHGFYSDTFTEPELALLPAFVENPTLDDEIWMQRVLNRRLMVHANLKDESGEGPTTDVLIKLAEALAIGTGRVAKLLLSRRLLTSGAATQLTAAVATILVEIGIATGQKL